MQIPALRDLPVWNSTPPQPKETVLSETWELWADAAARAVSLFDQAAKGQQETVTGLQPAFETSIRDSLKNGASPKTEEQWFTDYSDQTLAKWKAGGVDAAAAYPELFETTHQQIRGIIAELLPRIQREVEEMKQPAPPQTPVPPNVATPPPTDPVPMQPEPVDPAESTDNQGPDGAGPGTGGDSQGKGALGGDGESGDSEGKGGEKDGAGEGEGDKKEEEEEKAEGDKEDDKGGDKKLLPRVDLALPEAEVPNPPARTKFSDWFYRMAFWILLVLVILMGLGWFWHVRYLRSLLAYRERMELRYGR